MDLGGAGALHSDCIFLEHFASPRLSVEEILQRWRRASESCLGLTNRMPRCIRRATGICRLVSMLFRQLARCPRAHADALADSRVLLRRWRDGGRSELAAGMRRDEQE